MGCYIRLYNALYSGQSIYKPDAPSRILGCCITAHMHLCSSQETMGCYIGLYNALHTGQSIQKPDVVWLQNGSYECKVVL